MNEYPDVYATEEPEFPEESIGEPPEEESKYVDWAFLANCGVDEEEQLNKFYKHIITGTERQIKKYTEIRALS